MLQPFKEAGVDVEFYRVGSDLQVDLDDLRSRMGPDVLAAVVIHYFGFLQPSAVFDVLESADPPVYLIEDSSHMWRIRSTLRWPGRPHGTITVYSPRKFFPVPDGAMAVVGDGHSCRGPEVAPTHWGFALQRTVGLLLRWFFAKTGLQSINRLAFCLLQSAERTLDAGIRISHASWISKRILLNADLQAVAERRRQNYTMLAEALQDGNLPVRPLFDHLPIGVIPLGFPVLSSRRNELRDFLIERSVYPPIHWLLPGEAGIATFRHLVRLSANILTLPIDQRYGSREIAYILACLNDWRSISRQL